MKGHRGKQVLRKIGLTVGMLLIGWLSPGLGTAAVQKVDVCHRDDTGSFQLITVATQAVQAHKAHGDAPPGELMPGNPGFTFDDTCRADPASTCPCDSTPGGLASKGIDPDPGRSAGDNNISVGFVRIAGPTIDGQFFQAYTLYNATQQECLVALDRSILERVNGLTTNQFNDCANDIRSAAASLGITCTTR